MQGVDIHLTVMIYRQGLLIGYFVWMVMYLQDANTKVNIKDRTYFVMMEIDAWLWEQRKIKCVKGKKTQLELLTLLHNMGSLQTLD